MDLGLRNSVALVTGGAAGIGAAVVRLMVEEGMRVAFVDRNKSTGVRLAAALTRARGEVKFIHADLTREKDCQRCVRDTLRAFGSLDVLVHNAGVNDGVALDASPPEFALSLQKNLVHVFAITHFALEELKKSRGAIVNVGSKVALTGQGHTSGYAAAKGGVHALTREWAAALAPYGVRVNGVIPAECDTPQYQRWFNSRPDPTSARDSIEQMIPLGLRLTTPEEVAAAIVFLASPRSAHTTGQFLYVDGGYTHLDRALTQSGHEWKAQPAARARRGGKARTAQRRG